MPLLIKSEDAETVTYVGTPGDAMDGYTFTIRKDATALDIHLHQPDYLTGGQTWQDIVTMLDANT